MEWGIGLLHFKIPFLKSLSLKLTLLNSLLVGIVIVFTGVSVKDFACLLVNSFQLVGTEKNHFFNETMQFYLIRASLLSLIIAAILHFYFIWRLLVPLKRLTASMRMMADGHYPEALRVTSDDEIGQLTKDFNHLIRQLKNKDNQRKTMMAEIAHDLRTPLTNLNGYLEALSSEVITGTKEMYHSLHEESLHLIRLVEQIHQLHTWEVHQEDPAPYSSFEIKDLIEMVAKSFSLQAEKKNIEIATDLQQAKVAGSEDGIKQVLSNLLSNAIQYNTSDWIKVEGVQEDRYYRLVITNESYPIPEQKASKLFERFYRVDESRNRLLGGSGLGLTIVKEIISQHKGSVGYYSTGSIHSFWFSIPLLQNEQERTYEQSSS